MRTQRHRPTAAERAMSFFKGFGRTEQANRETERRTESIQFQNRLNAYRKDARASAKTPSEEEQDIAKAYLKALEKANDQDEAA